MVLFSLAVSSRQSKRFVFVAVIIGSVQYTDLFYLDVFTSRAVAI